MVLGDNKGARRSLNLNVWKLWGDGLDAPDNFNC